MVVGGQVDSRTGGFAISLLGTAVVALAFQPLRRWVVHLANRLAYGPRARPYVALSDFSSRLAETPTAEALLPAVADAAGRAVSARGATGSGRRPAGVVSASWGDHERGDAALRRPDPQRWCLPRSHHRAPPAGTDAAAADARLLQALADQAAVAFRNTAMETELAERVAVLDRTTHELVGSRARLIDADDAARRTLEAAISRDVFPGSRCPRAGAAHEAIAAGSGDHGLDELVRDTNTALESLRELTRGVFPTQLARTGLEPALRSCLSRSRAGCRAAGDPRRGRPAVLRPGGGRGLLLLLRGGARPVRGLRRQPHHRRARPGAADHRDHRRPDGPAGDPGPHRRSGRLVDDGGRRVPWSSQRHQWQSLWPAPAAHAAESRSGPNAALATYAAAPLPEMSNSSAS